MLSSITPLGERGRGQRWSVTAGAYVLGSLLGGLVVGALAGALGAVAALAVAALAGGADGDGTAGPPLVGVAAAAVLGAAALADRRGWRPPPRRRQVDEDWLSTYRGWVYGGAFGLQLGAGVLTIVTSAATWALLALALLSSSPAVGALLGAVFGLVRALPLLALRGAERPADVRRALRRVDRAAPASGGPPRSR